MDSKDETAGGTETVRASGLAVLAHALFVPLMLGFQRKEPLRPFVLFRVPQLDGHRASVFARLKLRN